MAKVDATQERELAKQYNIGGYPTVKFFRNGTPIDYKIIQDHDEQQIVDWLKKKTASPVQVITTPEQLDDLRNNFGVVVAGFFKAGFNSSGAKYANDSLAWNGRIFHVCYNSDNRSKCSVPQDVFSMRKVEVTST